MVGLQRQSVYTWCSRHRVKPVSREPGKAGQNLYNVEDILAAQQLGVNGDDGSWDNEDWD
jgi:hypothetical protein